jgi:hypothetical protein
MNKVKKSTKRFGFELLVQLETKTKQGKIEKTWYCAGKDFGTTWAASNYARLNYPGKKVHIGGVRVDTSSDGSVFMFTQPKEPSTEKKPESTFTVTVVS